MPPYGGGPMSMMGGGGMSSVGMGMPGGGPENDDEEDRQPCRWKDCFQ